MKHLKTLLLLSLSSVALSACSDLSSPPQELRRWGSVVVSATMNPDTTVGATVTAKFFNATLVAVTNSIEAAQTDACTIFGVDTTTSEVIGEKKAGDALTFAYGSETVELDWVPVQYRYDSPLTSPFSYVAGASGTITVPGSDDYPGGTVSVLLAEPLTPGEVVVSHGQPLSLTWNGSSSGTSAILVNLLYAWPATSNYANRMVACELKDDGTAVIPGGLLADFHESSTAFRKLTMTRFRTNYKELDDKTQLHINSSVEVNVPLN